jgi:segregation and condensation protein A
MAKVLERESGPAITALGVVAPPPILVQTPAFEGTLATLFRCVREHKVDLMEVPLEPICEAYLMYLMENADTNLDEAAAALTVLAYLLERKAWQLLPVPEEDEPEMEEPTALVDATVYEYGDVIQALVGGYEERSKLFFRTHGPDLDQYEIPFSVGEVTAGDLARAFERLLKRATPEPVELLSKPRKSIQEQMKVVLMSLSTEFKRIDDLFVGEYTRNDAVYWFLALLELIRLHRAAVKLEGEEVLFAKK